jgi:hypothetical protein
VRFGDPGWRLGYARDAARHPFACPYRQQQYTVSGFMTPRGNL